MTTPPISTAAVRAEDSSADPAADAILTRGWERVAEYDAAAAAQQARFRRQEFWALLLGVALTFVVILKSQLPSAATSAVADGGATTRPDAPSLLGMFHLVLWLLAVALPIVTSYLAAAFARAAAGQQWVWLRGAAESIKRELYLYRAGVGDYAADVAEQRTSATGGAVAPTSPAQRLAAKIAQIGQRLRASGAYAPLGCRASGLKQPGSLCRAADDDGLSPLSPDQYIKYRIEDQVAFYEKRVCRFQRTLGWVQSLIFVAGGVGAFLAAVGLSPWVAVTTAIGAALAAYLAYRQVEQTVAAYRQAAGSLGEILDWWHALGPERQAQPTNRAALVQSAEKVLEAEHARWSQQIIDALASLPRPSLPEPRQADGGRTGGTKDHASGTGATST